MKIKIEKDVEGTFAPTLLGYDFFYFTTASAVEIDI